MKKQCKETTLKGKRCRNTARIGALCMPHLKRRMQEAPPLALAPEGKEIQQEVPPQSTPLTRKEEMLRFWKIFGTVMGAFLIAFLIALFFKWALVL